MIHEAILRCLLLRIVYQLRNLSQCTIPISNHHTTNLPDTQSSRIFDILDHPRATDFRETNRNQYHTHHYRLLLQIASRKQTLTMVAWASDAMEELSNLYGAYTVHSIITCILCLKVWLFGELVLAPVEEQRHALRKLESRCLVVATFLEHVAMPEGERCVICHEDKPAAPVRISCQHFFCCSCAHAAFAWRDVCPLCLQKPSSLRETTPISMPRFDHAVHEPRRLVDLVREESNKYTLIFCIPALVLLRFLGDRLPFVQTLSGFLVLPTIFAIFDVLTDVFGKRVACQACRTRKPTLETSVIQNLSPLPARAG